MKANEIILALGLPTTKERKAHASTLADIYKHLDSIKNEVVSLEVIVKDFIYGQKYSEGKLWEIRKYGPKNVKPTFQGDTIL